MPDAALAMTSVVRATAQPFEESFFGGPVWRLSLDGGNVTEADVAQEIARARSADVRLVFCRVDADSGFGRVLETAGFRPIEKLVTFRRAVPAKAKPVAEMGVAEPKDSGACAAIAGAVFRHDRYHVDPEISDEIADQLKATWVRNGVQGRADAALIARREGAIAGFNLCMCRGDRAVIDLIAVAAAFQGQGIGRALVAGALAHYAGQVAEMDVGTQETNSPSIALYRSMGFAPVSVARTYHWTP